MGQTVFYSTWGLTEKFIGWPRYSWNVTKWGLFFKIVSLPAHTLLLSLLQYLDSIGKKKLYIADMTP